jgi:hypothetical protein
LATSPDAPHVPEGILELRGQGSSLFDPVGGRGRRDRAILARPEVDLLEEIHEQTGAQNCSSPRRREA